MALASGIFKQLAYKVESTYGQAPGQASGQSLRRVQSTLDLSKDTYQSGEIRTDQQVADFRHGVRRVQGSLSGELSPGNWKDFFGAILKRDFAAVTPITAAGLTIAGAGPTYTVTRAAGSYLTDGIKIGDVVRLSVGSLNANNINKNLLVTALTATIMTVVVLNATVMTAEGPISGCTVTVIGKKTFTPLTGHTDRSFSVEHWFSDVPTSELFLGVKMTQVAIDLPPTGLATVNWTAMGQDFADTTAKRTAIALSSQYFTSPTAASAGASLAAVNGVVRVGGVSVAVLTGLSINIAANFTGDPVVGANVIPNQFPGRVVVTGQAMMYFENATIRDTFVNETEVDIVCAFTADNSAIADFITFVIPRVKFGGSSKDDGEKGIVQTLPFQALLNLSGGAAVATERTTLSIQDSLA